MRFFLTTTILLVACALGTASAQQPTTPPPPPAAPSTEKQTEQKTEEQKKETPTAPVKAGDTAAQEPQITVKGTFDVWHAVTPPETPTPDDRIVIALTGDVMLGSTFPDTTGGSLPPEDGAHLLDEVAPFLRAADLAFGNLEGPLYDGSETSYKCEHRAANTCYAFRVPTRYAKLLADAGYDVMGTANNHGNDFGPAGLASSAKTLDDAGIMHSGEPGSVARLQVKDKRVAVIAFTTYPIFNNFLDLENARTLVQKTAAEADIVIVSFHGGAEGADRQHVPRGSEKFLGEDRGDLRRFAHVMINAGATMVVGHGPHVVRGMETYHGRLIAYSLGNFATYGHINLRGVNGLSLVLEVELGMDGRFLGGKIHPAFQEYPGGPHVDERGRVIDVVRALSAADFGKNAIVVDKDGSIKEQIEPVGIVKQKKPSAKKK